MEALFVVVAIAASQGNPDVSRSVTEAYVKQTKLDEALEAYQARLINESTRRQVSRIAAVARVGIERRVLLQWTFP